jgi:drug/metabolite transporter (DMT)-like permease
MAAAAAVPGPPAIAAGIGFAALGFGLFTGMDTMVKWLGAAYPLHQIVFFNSLFSLVPMAVMIAWSGGLRQLRTRRPGLHVLRGGFALVSTAAAFYAYTRMPLADAYAIIFTGPLLVTALSALILKEPVGWRRWSAIGVGFAGVLIMLRPGAGVLGQGAVAALVCAVGYALSVVTLRKLSATETTASFLFYGNLTILAATGALLAFEFARMPWADLALLAACGLTGGTAFIAIVNAHRRAPAAIVAPFQYTQMAWGALLGFLIWGDVPQPSVVLGCAVVVASGLFILYRETRLRAGAVSGAGRPATA